MADSWREDQRGSQTGIQRAMAVEFFPAFPPWSAYIANATAQKKLGRSIGLHLNNLKKDYGKGVKDLQLTGGADKMEEDKLRKHPRYADK